MEFVCLKMGYIDLTILNRNSTVVLLRIEYNIFLFNINTS